MAEKKFRSASIREFVDSTGRKLYDVILKENEEVKFSKVYVQRLAAFDRVYDWFEIEGK